jgi:hypothetical protein
VPGYRLNVVNFPSFTFCKTLPLPQPVTTIVVVVRVATFCSETARYNTNWKRTTEGAARRDHVVLAQILSHHFPITVGTHPSLDPCPTQSGVLQSQRSEPSPKVGVRPAATQGRRSDRCPLPSMGWSWREVSFTVDGDVIG